MRRSFFLICNQTFIFTESYHTEKFAIKNFKPSEKKYFEFEITNVIYRNHGLILNLTLGIMIIAISDHSIQ